MVETAQQFLAKNQGQSLLYNTADPTLRGQCVQSVCFFVQDNGYPVIWADAAEWWNKRNARYDYIVNTPDAVPQPGDIIIWNGNLPGSGGAGHIAICLYALPGTGTFVSVDQNWGGKIVHAVTHNYNYVTGWMRFKPAGGMGGGSPAPVPTPAQQQGDEMIANNDQAIKIYKLLRPNGGASDGEIAQTAGHRTFAQFLNDAQAEVNARDANLRDQAQHIVDLQNTINSTNQTVTELRATINSDQVSNAEKQKALEDALAQISKDNAEMTTLHDHITDLQKQLAEPVNSPAPVIANAEEAVKETADKSSGFVVAAIKYLLQLKFARKSKS